MSRKRAVSADSAPAQPSRWREQQRARRLAQLGFLGLLEDSVLGDICTRIDPRELYGNGPFQGQLHAVAADAATMRLWIDRWPAFDWSKFLADTTTADNTDYASSLLLDDRVDPRALGFRAANDAAANGNDELVARFLTHPRVVLAESRMLQAAATHGHTRILVKLLADGRFDPSATGSFALPGIVANQPIVDVLAVAPLDAIQLMVFHARVDPAASDNRLIREAAKLGRADVVRMLTRIARVNPAACNNEPLINAIEGRFETIALQLLLDPRVDPAARNNTPIALAATKGCDDVVRRLLLDARVDPAISNNRPIRLAASEGCLAVVDRLLALPAVDPTANDQEALKLAIGGGHALVVARLCDDPRVDPTANGQWPFEFACSLANPDVVTRLLADHRIVPSHKDNVALRKAIGCGHVDNVALLLADPRIELPPDLIDATVAGPMLALLLADARINPRGCATYEEWAATAGE